MSVGHIELGEVEREGKGPENLGEDHSNRGDIFIPPRKDPVYYNQEQNLRKGRYTRTQGTVSSVRVRTYNKGLCQRGIG